MQREFPVPASSVEPKEIKEDPLCLFLRRLGPSCETLSRLLQRRESFGLAWFAVFLLTRNASLGKVRVDPPTGIDLSGIRGVSPKKVHLFLQGLPAFVEEMKIDSFAVKRGALELFTGYLEHLRDARENGRPAPRLKKFAFADKSIGSLEAARILPLILPRLESLSLKGNHVGAEGFEVLGRGIRNGQCVCLRALDLENTGIATEGLEILVSAIKEKPLGVEMLCLSDNDLNTSKYWYMPERSRNRMGILCSILHPSHLPCVRDLRLARCEMEMEEFQQLGGVLGKGHLPKLESLDFEGNSFYGHSFDDFGIALCIESVPCLKRLNLLPAYDWHGGIGSEFLKALRADKCPPLEDVTVALRGLNEEESRDLGSMQYPAIRSLRLHAEPDSASAFFRGCLETSDGPKFDFLHLRVEVGNEGLRLLGQGIEMKRFNSIRNFQLSVHGDSATFFLAAEAAFNAAAEGGDEMQLLPRDPHAEGKVAFWTALNVVPTPNLSALSVTDYSLDDAQMPLLVGAVQEGNLSGLRKLNLRCFPLGREGMDSLMGSVVESRDGLPLLEELDLCETGAGEGLGSLGMALASGKLKRLSKISMIRCGITAEAVRDFAVWVRAGSLVCVSSLILSKNFLGVGSWGELMEAIVDSEKGAPRLEQLSILDPYRDPLGQGGPYLSALGSGKLPSLRNFPVPSCFLLNAEGLQTLSVAVRAGQFPPRLCSQFHFIFQSPADQPRVNLDPLMLAVAQNQKGLPPFIKSLRFERGRLGEAALASLASSGEVGGGRFSGLKRLSFTDCDIDDQILRRLAEVFNVHKFPSLTALGLERNRISRDGVKQFCDTLTSEALPEVQGLSLWGQQRSAGGQTGVESCGGEGESAVAGGEGSGGQGDRGVDCFTSSVDGVLRQAQSLGKLKECEVFEIAPR
uniref:Uncharacterized protein n=1 Tax=Chromera velia CCMP2878 TaxID=1169474 RepID=A0A0G4I5P3_9ALVE|eukprot:Cvel_11193.t1-p1 / transcript=Cvel_11193.t1 / gene=Cvel_11193 / organism=Chromera_velia_CCMP2878 / gene_product=hypothetical protein / transcript_product=hypothetical protein / location=Cvel_scaffold695:47027-52234(+) / protein_length=913 / sequence_SO=supercontig / SO=protein_coding / is_pseudo=false